MADRRESGKFAAQYRKLNAEQKKAVDAIEGPVIVIAGPGTGKTQILTLRIAQILRETDTPPDGILALTFTESAAFSMRRRLIDIIGAAAYRVHIHTFHGYAQAMIERFPESFPRIIGSRNISDVERYSLLREIIDSEELRHLRPYGQPYYYLAEISSRLSELKRENISPQRWQKMCAGREKAFASIPDLHHQKGARAGAMKGAYAQLGIRLERDRDLAAVYRRYEEELAARHLYDYEDMLLEAIRALEANRDLLMTMQEEAIYILADEHQDANDAQNRLLELLASFHERPNLFVVGDEKQAVYRFQGASLDNFLYFRNKYPGAAVVVLRENYRSRQEILDAAHSLSERMPVVSGIERRPLRAARRNGAGGEVRVLALPRPQDERQFAAREIRRLVDEGVDPSEIAVLTRLNRDADEMAAALQRLGVPHFVESQKSALNHPLVRKLGSILDAIAHYGADEHLVPALHVDFLVLPQLAVTRLLMRGGTGGREGVETERRTLWEIMGDKAALEEIGIKRPGPFAALSGKLLRWSALDRGEGLLPALNAILEESGVLPYMLKSQQPDEELAIVHALFEEARSLQATNRTVRASDFLQHLALLHEYNLPLNIARTPGDRAAVRIMTAHRAKGLEFSYVYILHVNEGRWGNRRERRYFSPISAGLSLPPVADQDEERRLLYVAITRAKLSCTLTYARGRETGALMLPSQFVEELDPHVASSKELPAEPMALFSSRAEASGPKARLDKNFVRAALGEQGLSVSSLENYLQCPWKYFYRNLLGVPEAPQKTVEYGAAVHAALKHYFDLLKEGNDIGQHGLVRLFERAIRGSALAERDFEDSLQKGRAALAAYWEQRRESFRTSVMNVLQITVFLTTEIENFPRLKLRGVLDKMEFENDQDVIVYDYKTGPRQTRGEIEGKGADPKAWGEHKRQLVFYKLLLSHFDYGRWRMIRGVVEFVEPDKRGICAREEFDMAGEDAERDEQALSHLLREAANDIYTLKFARRRCSDKDCKYCRWRDLLER